MRTHRSDLEPADHLSRRLASLGEELSGIRAARPQPSSDDLTQAPWWDDHTRAAAPRGPAPASPAPPVPRPLPGRPPSRPPRRLPGRHAARSRAPSLVALGPAHLAVVAVVVALGLAVTCWWLVRGSAHPTDDLEAAPARSLVQETSAVAPALEPVAETPEATAPTPASATPATPATVTVDVAGKVRHPGIAVLDAGARVVDALEAAGGPKSGVDLTGLNLARPLVDGEQVLVGVDPPTGHAATALPAPGAASPPATDGSATTLVNLNTATETELDTLPDVGPVTAQSILAWRDQHGGFTSVDELLEIDGIGEVTLGKLAPYVTV